MIPIPQNLSSVMLKEVVVWGLQYLNSHPVLYKVVVGVEQSPETLTTDEARRAAKTLRMDFERGGIHLPPGKDLYHLCDAERSGCLSFE